MPENMWSDVYEYVACKLRTELLATVGIMWGHFGIRDERDSSSGRYS